MLSIATVIGIVLLIASHVHIASVLGTTAAATVAACATFARSHYRTTKFVRFAIRARLTKKAEPDFEKLTRQFRDKPIGKYLPKSSHPSPEIKQALRDAESRMGLTPGTTMALIVPLELILGVPHNCPAAAAMLYAGRHPVILIDDQLLLLLDSDENYERNYDVVVSVLCHEISHLVGWNTRWSSLIAICELFVTTAAMASLVAYSLENNFSYGIIGAIIAAIYLASEPALRDEEISSSTLAMTARIALLCWVPYVIVGLFIGTLPLSLTMGVTVFALGLRLMLASFRRRQELYADLLAAIALGTSAPLTNFFRTIKSETLNFWHEAFSSHPSTQVRIKNLTRSKI